MNTRFLDKWATQRRKGLLDLCVPNAMARGREGVKAWGAGSVAAWGRGR